MPIVKSNQIVNFQSYIKDAGESFLTKHTNNSIYMVELGDRTGSSWSGTRLRLDLGQDFSLNQNGANLWTAYKPDQPPFSIVKNGSIKSEGGEHLFHWFLSEEEDNKTWLYRLDLISDKIVKFHEVDFLESVKVYDYDFDFFENNGQVIGVGTITDNASGNDYKHVEESVHLVRLDIKSGQLTHISLSAGRYMASKVLNNILHVLYIKDGHFHLANMDFDTELWSYFDVEENSPDRDTDLRSYFLGDYMVVVQTKGSASRNILDSIIHRLNLLTRVWDQKMINGLVLRNSSFGVSVDTNLVIVSYEGYKEQDKGIQIINMDNYYLAKDLNGTQLNSPNISPILLGLILSGIFIFLIILVNIIYFTRKFHEKKSQVSLPDYILEPLWAGDEELASVSSINTLAFDELDQCTAFDSPYNHVPFNQYEFIASKLNY